MALILLDPMQNQKNGVCAVFNRLSCPTRKSKSFAFVVFSLVVFSLMPAGAASVTPIKVVAKSDREAALCTTAIGQVERENRIPLYLLRAIALKETGRWDGANKVSQAWPWTVTAEGQGQYFPRKKDAIAAVKALMSRGVRSIDVGCLQINLRYHADAFVDLEAAFDPLTNAQYAGKFLHGLRRELHSWTLAVGGYHSRTPARAGPYRHKVIRLWRKLQQDANKRRAS